MTFLYALATLWPKVKLHHPITTALSLTIFFISVLSNAQVQSVGERADAGLTHIKPLSIGDTVPEAVWNMPLQVVNHPQGKETITLNDYRGKLIILDFWSTWCGPCIRSLPKIDSIQQDLSGKIQILLFTRDSKDRLKEFFGSEQKSQNISIPILSETSYLLALFPHVTIPHIIVVDKTGVVKAITNSKGITKESVVSLINDIPVAFPLKKDYNN